MLIHTTLLEAVLDRGTSIQDNSTPLNTQKHRSAGDFSLSISNSNKPTKDSHKLEAGKQAALSTVIT
jgi:hypothetical protein